MMAFMPIEHSNDVIDIVDEVASEWFKKMHACSVDAIMAEYIGDYDAAFRLRVKCEQLRDCANEIMRVIYGTHEKQKTAA